MVYCCVSVIRFTIYGLIQSVVGAHIYFFVYLAKLQWRQIVKGYHTNPPDQGHKTKQHVPVVKKKTLIIRAVN